MNNPRRGLCAGLALAAALLPSSARGNGRFPAAQHVVLGDPGHPGVIALRTTFGFLVSADGGRSFRYLCEEAVGYGAQEFDPGFALDAQARLHVGLPYGLARVSADGCTTERNPVADQQYVTDLDNSADGRVLVGVGAPGIPGARSRVIRSDDGGDSFRALGGGVADVRFDTLEMAATDTQRIYLSGLTLSPVRALIYRSDDGGATLREVPFAQASAVTAAYVAGVDPQREDTVYLRAVLPRAGTDSGGVPGAVLLRSDDGAATFREVARTVGPMLGFALSDDGRTVWYGGSDPADGLFRSDDGGASFARVSAAHVTCLRQHAGVLYVCGDDAADGYALGRSMDGGRTISPVLRLADVAGAVPCGPLADGATSIEGTVCAARWSMLREQFFARDAGVSRDAATTAAIDASAPPAPRRLAGGGCQCAAVPRRSPELPELLPFVAVALASARRRRARDVRQRVPVASA